jgi:oligopeptidase B
MSVPVPHTTLKKITLHDVELPDDYAWLRDENWPKVASEPILSYLQSENSYFNDYFLDKQPLKERIMKEIENRTTMFGKSIAVRQGDFLYYFRREQELDYKIYCRQNINTLTEEIILDINQLSRDKNFCNILDVSICPKNRYLAYSVDYVGFEQYSTYVIDLDEGKKLVCSIENASNIVWHEEIAGFFFVRQDEKWRNKTAFFHFMDSSKEDKLVYCEQNEQAIISVNKASSKNFLFLISHDSGGNEIYYLNLKEDQHFNFKIILPYRNNIRYDIEHHKQHFYILINDAGPNYRLGIISIDDIKAGNNEIKTYVEYDQSQSIQSFDITRDYLLLNYLKDGIPIQQVHCLNTFMRKIIQLPTEDEIFVSQVFCNHFEDNQIYISYSSLSCKTKCYDYNFSSDKLQVIYDENVNCKIDSSQYIVKRLFADNAGTKVPITLFMRKDALKAGPTKLFLYGYGSYGIGEYLGHSAFANVLVDQGFIYAIAHVRGGGHLGEAWYEDGKLLKKANTFTDFIECTKHLIQNNYTKKQNIVICGGSAGGMLIGAVLNKASELYKGAMLIVPFVDVLNTMLDDTLPLTPGEWQEWGNPCEKEYFNYIKSYCPYFNISDKGYPHIFVTSSIFDQRVGYWEAAKWIAKLRKNNTSSSKILFYTDMQSGHGGSSSRKKKFEELALEIVFAISIFN